MGDMITAHSHAHKPAHHSEKIKNNLSTRLKRIEGQVRGIENMIMNDVYCDNVLNQISSIQSALGSVRNILLETHIKSCIKESIEKGDEEIITELMNTLSRMFK